jgi:acyl-CoA reductase-like NAD-dependent aldehyde dehydrogenase
MKHQHEVVENFQLQITQLRTCLENKAPEIINILCEFETPATANTEVHDTIKTLSELSNDFDPKHFQYLNLLVTYQPSNLPLYSLILYCIIPSFYFNRVAVYIPHELRPIIKQLAYHLNLTELFEGVCVSDFSRRVFEDAFSSSANTIIFNGKYDNALFVIDKYPSNILFIYSGSGFNPIIIDEQSDTDQALDKLMTSRLFNSGQDCGAPDIIFVHDSVYDTLVAKLKNALTEFCVNFRRNGGVSLYPIIRESTFTEWN